MLIRFLPLKGVIYLAKYTAQFLTIFIKIRGEAVLEHLAFAFPDMPLKEKEQIRNRMYESILMASFESYKYMYLSKKQKQTNLIIDERSKKVLDDAYNQNRGVTVVGGHFGFFEGGGHLVSSMGYKVSFVVANQKNKLTEKLIDEPREKAGLGVIHRKQMRKLFRAYDDGHCVALLSDQDAGKRGVFIDFFGKRASTHKNAATLALKKGIPIITVCQIRDKKDITKHHISFKELKYKDIEAMDISYDQKVTTIVQRYASVLESEVRENPDHYWWVHKRFRTKEKK